MTRIVAVDFGEKRCGIANTDELQIAVHPLCVVANAELKHYLQKYIRDENVSKIVFGKPVHPDGNPTFLWTKIQTFCADLNKTFPTLEIDFQDESFTSSEAQKIMIIGGMKKKKRRNKENLDLISAVLILQRYLRHI